VKKNLKLKNGVSLLLVMITALFISACGSSSTTDGKAAPLAYDGITEPAAITAENAEELASKSVGLGFLSDISQVVSGVNVDTAQSSKGDSSYNISGYGGILLLDTYEKMYEGYGGIIDIAMFEKLERQSCYPNVGGTFEDTITTAIDQAAGTITFTGDLIFDNARHDSDIDCKDIIKPTIDNDIIFVGNTTVNGRISVNYVFDISEDTPEDVYGSGWVNTPSFELLAKMIESYNQNHYFPLTDQLNTYTDFTSQRSITNPIEMSWGQEIVSMSTMYLALNGNLTSTLKVDKQDLGLSDASYAFEGTKFNQDYHGGEPGIYGTNILTRTVIFDGDMTLSEDTFNLDNNSGSKTLNEDNKIASTIKITLSNGTLEYRETREDTFAKPSATELTMENILESTLEMDGIISVDYSFSDAESAVELTANINGKIKENGSKTDLITKKYKDDYTSFEDSNFQTEDDNENETQIITGFATATVKTTTKPASVETDVFPWVTETTKFELKSGSFSTASTSNYSIENTWVAIPEEPVDESDKAVAADGDITPDVDEDGNIYTKKIVVIDNKSKTVKLSGNAKVYRDEKFIAIGGEIVFDGINNLTRTANFNWVELSKAAVQDGDIEEEDTISNLITLNNLALRSDFADLLLQGTLDIAQLPKAYSGTEKYNADDYTLQLIIDLVLKDNVNNESYKLDDYRVDIISPMFASEFKMKDSPESTISIEGNFYHSAFGYVEVSTLTTPFTFPNFTGMATITGTDNTKATVTLKRINDDTVYEIFADTTGDGNMDLGPVVTVFPDFEDTIDGFWLSDASDIMGALVPNYLNTIKL